MILMNSKLYNITDIDDLKLLERDIYSNLKATDKVYNASKLSNRINYKLNNMAFKDLIVEFSRWVKFGIYIEYIPNENNLYYVFLDRKYNVISGCFENKILVENDHNERMLFTKNNKNTGANTIKTDQIDLSNSVIFGRELIKLGFSKINPENIYYMF